MSQERTFTDAETYSALIVLMRDLGLEWVADEVENSIRAGELEVRDAPRARGERNRELELPELARIPSLEAVRTPFGPRDRVRLAVEAIGRVVIDTAAMELEIRAELDAPVFIVDDDPEAVPQQIVRDQPANLERLNHLRRLLAQLETEG